MYFTLIFEWSLYLTHTKRSGQLNWGSQVEDIMIVPHFFACSSAYPLHRLTTPFCENGSHTYDCSPWTAQYGRTEANKHTLPFVLLSSNLFSFPNGQHFPSSIRGSRLTTVMTCWRQFHLCIMDRDLLRGDDLSQDTDAVRKAGFLSITRQVPKVVVASTTLA